MKVLKILFSSAIFPETDDTVSESFLNFNDHSPIIGTNGQFVFTPTSLLCEGTIEELSMLSVTQQACWTQPHLEQ